MTPNGPVGAQTSAQATDRRRSVRYATAEPRAAPYKRSAVGPA
jgi:hypothetical protein